MDYNSESKQNNNELFFEEFGRRLENNNVVTLDTNGFVVESHSGMCLARNGKELDLLIAWMETLRKQMPE